MFWYGCTYGENIDFIRSWDGGELISILDDTFGSHYLLIFGKLFHLRMTKRFYSFVQTFSLLILFSCSKDVVEPFTAPILKFTIATSSGAGGLISPSQSVESSQTVKITATANAHFQLKEWTGDCGTFDKDDLEITITASKNCAVGAEFEKIKYTITATPEKGGVL